MFDCDPIDPATDLKQEHREIARNLCMFMRGNDLSVFDINMALVTMQYMTQAELYDRH